MRSRRQARRLAEPPRLRRGSSGYLRAHTARSRRCRRRGRRERPAAYTVAVTRAGPALRERWQPPPVRAGEYLRNRRGRSSERSLASCELARHLRQHSLVRLRVSASLAPRMAPGLRAAPPTEVRVVLDQMPLCLHGFHGLTLSLPDRRDVEQHVGLEIALLRLVRFEHEDRRRAERRPWKRIALRLRVDARVQRDLICGW